MDCPLWPLHSGIGDRRDPAGSCFTTSPDPRFWSRLVSKALDTGAPWFGPHSRALGNSNFFMARHLSNLDKMLWVGHLEEVKGQGSGVIRTLLDIWWLGIRPFESSYMLLLFEERRKSLLIESLHLMYIGKHV